MLVRLLYASRAVDPSAEAIEAILTQSRHYNPTCGITGILCYGGGVFLQARNGVIQLSWTSFSPSLRPRAWKRSAR